MDQLINHVGALVAITGYRAGDSVADYKNDKGRRFIRSAFSNRGGELIAGFNNSLGYWRGDREPSHLFTMDGDPVAVEQWASELASEYLQDAVAVFHVNPAGPDLLAVIDFAGDDNAALAAVNRAGVDCVTVSDGYVLIMGSTSEVLADAQAVINTGGGLVVGDKLTRGDFNLIDTASEFASIVAA